MKLLFESWRKLERREIINENIELMQAVTDKVKAYHDKAPEQTPKESWKIVDKYWGPWDKKNDALSDALEDAESPQEMRTLMQNWKAHVKTMTPMLQKMFDEAEQVGAQLGKDVIGVLYKAMDKNLQHAKLMGKKNETPV